MIPIPYGADHTATLRGRVPKSVVCEQCSRQYVYFLERSGSGEGFSFLFLDEQGARDRALDEARARLFHALLAACEPVPCPDCGHIQTHMIPRARQLHTRWMGRTALYLFPIAIICFLPALIATGIYNQNRAMEALIVAVWAWAAVGIAALGAIVLPLWKMVASRAYDPNAEDVEIRKDKGRELAIAREDFGKQYPGSEPIPQAPPPEAITPDRPAR